MALSRHKCGDPIEKIPPKPPEAVRTIVRCDVLIDFQIVGTGSSITRKHHRRSLALVGAKWSAYEMWWRFVGAYMWAHIYRARK